MSESNRLLKVIKLLQNIPPSQETIQAFMLLSRHYNVILEKDIEKANQIRKQRREKRNRG